MNYFQASWYWDNENIYTFQWFNFNSAQCFLVEKFNTNTKLKTIWNVPIFEFNANNISGWANNNGLLLYFYTGEFILPSPFGSYRYTYFSNSLDYLTLQSNNGYLSNAFGSKTYTTDSGLLKNVYNLGVEIDEYENVEF